MTDNITSVDGQTTTVAQDQYMAIMICPCINDDGKTENFTVHAIFDSEEAAEEAEGLSYDTLLGDINGILPKGWYVDDQVDGNGLYTAKETFTRTQNYENPHVLHIYLQTSRKK